MPKLGNLAGARADTLPAQKRQDLFKPVSLWYPLPSLVPEDRRLAPAEVISKPALAPAAKPTCRLQLLANCLRSWVRIIAEKGLTPPPRQCGSRCSYRRVLGSRARSPISPPRKKVGRGI